MKTKTWCQLNQRNRRNLRCPGINVLLTKTSNKNVNFEFLQVVLSNFLGFVFVSRPGIMREIKQLIFGSFDGNSINLFGFMGDKFRRCRGIN